MTDAVTVPSRSRSRKKLIGGAAAAVAIAAVVVVGFVLPAEYGIDPTGIGKAMGLTKMAAPENIYLKRGQARTGVLFPLAASAKVDEATLRQTLPGKTLPAAMGSDRFEFELPPFESIELKYDLAQGAPMVFSWRATGPVSYDMHAHPFEGGEALTESYSITNAPAQSGVYVAPFTGIHGWFWQNQSLEPVTLTLQATGGFTGSRTFSVAGEVPRPLTGSIDASPAPAGTR